jgi:hypothetical protein
MAAWLEGENEEETPRGIPQLPLNPSSTGVWAGIPGWAPGRPAGEPVALGLVPADISKPPFLHFFGGKFCVGSEDDMHNIDR